VNPKVFYQWQGPKPTPDDVIEVFATGTGDHLRVEATP
jgi:hypothetical protein